MRYRNARPLCQLIDTVLDSTPKDKRIQYLVMQAWYHVLPNTKGQLYGSFIKDNALYIKAGSFLRHELSLEKDKIQKLLKEALEELGGDPQWVHQILLI